MEFIRIGEKLISAHKINDTVQRILHLRSEGLSQQEVAAKLQIDRTFISRLESIGNVRRGGRIGLVAFPVQNKEELIKLADRYGIENRLILTNQERWQLVAKKNGLDFLNKMMEIIEQLRQCETVLVFCSKKWNRIARALLDSEVFTTEIGSSPISEDIYINPTQIESILASFVSEGEEK
ncbi:MAG TPA: helix-turn-helix transcriptional regulator [Oscillospiraceae bacterium]|nr:helix-turn-helix transcriptional regulator [Oscillospiraceae bacterium]